jgi:hypothetical protein
MPHYVDLTLDFVNSINEGRLAHKRMMRIWNWKIGTQKNDENLELEGTKEFG